MRWGEGRVGTDIKWCVNVEPSASMGALRMNISEDGDVMGGDAGRCALWFILALFGAPASPSPASARGGPLSKMPLDA